MRILPVCCVTFISFVAPISLQAASGVNLIDLTNVEQFLQAAQEEERRQVQEAVEQEGEEFFPVAEGEGDVSAYSDFVTVVWRGVPYDLKDVPRQTWFAPYVRDMVNRGIVTGYKDAGGRPIGEFGPAKPVSVEEAAKMVLAAAGVDPTTCAATPKNKTAVGRWSQQYIACAEARKLTLFRDGAVDVTRPALRGEVAMTLLEAFGVLKPLASYSGSLVVSPASAPSSGSGTNIRAQSGSLFKDVMPDLPAAPAILRAAADGIIAGYKDAQGNLTGVFGPANAITRAEVSKVLSLAIQVYAVEEKASSSSSSSSQ